MVNVENIDKDPIERKSPEKKLKADNNNNEKKSSTGCKVSNSSHVSHNDPDAKAGTSNKRLYFKTHHIVDADSRIITDCVVTSEAIGDCSIAQERMEIQRKKYQFQVNELIVDRFYGNGAFYSYLKEPGIEAFIRNMGKSFNEGHGSNIGFKYNKENDVYSCKQGHVLKPYKNTVGSAGNTYIYRMLGCHCKTCPQKLSCLSGRKRQLESEKKIIKEIFLKI
ncbi:MAG: hypothetical protein AB8G05_11525 [Oligoflexales bacterium]